MKAQTVYVVVRADNQAYYAVFEKLTSAQEFAAVLRVPTEIIEQHIAV
jgi:hypothetical protein